MVNKVFDFIKQNKIIEYGDSVLLGVSGGADSVCMLHILCALKQTMSLKLLVVHINHHIRGKDADNDAAYVQKLCRNLDVPFILADVYVQQLAKEKGLSEEEAGRQARYEEFFRIGREHHVDKIAVAHNLNDHSETILFHLFRGTGIRGLMGIPMKRDQIVRPLLRCTRAEIETYLKQNGIAYCMDYTNETTAYSRNRIRLKVLPYIKENINAKAEYNIVNAAENLSEIADYMNQEAERAYVEYVSASCLSERGFELHPALMGMVVRKMIEKQAGKLKDITRKHIASVIALKGQPVSKRVDLPYGLVAERTYEGICIDWKKQEHSSKMTEETLIIGGEIYPHDKIKIALEPDVFQTQNIPEMLYTKWLNYDKIDKLTVRNRQEGDYIVIDHQGRKKKLKDYFIDEKIPRNERDEILLLADGSHVVWVIGHRISAAYKVTADTSRVVRITYQP